MERFAKVDELLKEYESLEAQMADPSIHADQNKARSLGKRYAQLGPVIAGYRAYKLAEDDLAAGKELAEADPAFASEISALESAKDEAAALLEELLLPRDPNDDRDVIMEIKAGAGGDESAIFAGDLFRMYSRFAEVPETESQGRIHTSAAGVLILPEAEEIDVDINMNDLRIDVYRSSGPGGQSVNTTDSAVRITHIPTGIVVSCQNEKSQLQNKESALRILRARMLAAAQEEAERIASAERKNQVRTVDRSERIRTYNFPENRLSDHRVNYKANNLDAVMNGDLEAVIQSLIDADRTSKLAAGNS